MKTEMLDALPFMLGRLSLGGESRESPACTTGKVKLEVRMKGFGREKHTFQAGARLSEDMFCAQASPTSLQSCQSGPSTQEEPGLLSLPQDVLVRQPCLHPEERPLPSLGWPEQTCIVLFSHCTYVAWADKSALHLSFLLCHCTGGRVV